MMDAQSEAGQPEREQQRRLRRLVSTLRAHGGVGTVGPACHRDIPGVDGVVLAVLAAHAGRIIISGSGPHGDQLEDLHATLGEGPGIDAAVTAGPVTAADLTRAQARRNWPRFTAQALTCGIRAVVAYPVLLHARPVGVLSLYRANPGPLSAAEHQQVDHYAHAVPVLLLDDLGTTGSGQMSIALPIHAGEVQQAVGVVMESAGVDAATALHRLRAYAHHSARPMRDVVAEVRTCRLPFDPTAPT
jgi:GAF domain-containing protein